MTLLDVILDGLVDAKVFPDREAALDAPWWKVLAMLDAVSVEIPAYSNTIRCKLIETEEHAVQP